MKPFISVLPVQVPTNLVWSLLGGFIAAACETKLMALSPALFLLVAQRDSTATGAITQIKCLSTEDHQKKKVSHKSEWCSPDTC